MCTKDTRKDISKKIDRVIDLPEKELLKEAKKVSLALIKKNRRAYEALANK